MRVIPHLLGFGVHVPVCIAASMACAIVTLDMLALKHPPFPEFSGAHREPDDVQNYVLFNRASGGGFMVITGTEYASATTKAISKQWCYIAQHSGASEITTTLATIDETGSVTQRELSPDALASLGLSESEAGERAKTHCRFQ